MLIFCSGLIIGSATAQTEEEEKKKPEKVVIEVGSGGITIVNEEGDTTQIILKSNGKNEKENEGLSEEEIRSSWKIDLGDDSLEYKDDGQTVERKKKIKTGVSQNANWSGIDFGVGLLTRPDFSTGFESTTYLDFDPARSWTINFNFFEHYFGIVKSNVGFVTGVGFNWSHFGYRKNFTFDYGNDTIVGALDSTRNYRKNRIRAMYLQVPALIQFNIPGKYGQDFHLSVGVVGGVRIGSQLKQKFTEGSIESKNKVRGGNYYFSPFKADAMARLGYGDWGAFVSYNLVPLFDKAVVEPVHNFAFGLMYNF